MKHLLPFVAVVFGFFLGACPANSAAEPAAATTGPTAASPRPLITVLPAAQAKLRAILADIKAGETTYVRVSVKAGGCTGFMYDMKLDDTPLTDADIRQDLQGLRVVVDRKSALFLEGTKIDFYSGADGKQGFTFDNPNAAKEKPQLDKTETEKPEQK